MASKYNTLTLRNAALILAKIMQSEELQGFSDQFLLQTHDDLLAIAKRYEERGLSSTVMWTHGVKKP